MKLRLGWIWMMVAPFTSFSCTTSGGVSAQGATTEECSSSCAKVAAVDCGDIGAECVDSCLKHPLGAVPEECTDEVEAFLDCFWVAESYFCDDLGTQALGCDNQHQAALSCIDNPGGGGAGADGAGGAAAGGASGAEGGSE